MYKTQVKNSTSITPHMIREAVEVLQMRKLFVNTTFIADYLKRYYPVESETLEAELTLMLKYAVKVGLIVKCGHDGFCIPTLLQDANAIETSDKMALVSNNDQLPETVSSEDNNRAFNED